MACSTDSTKFAEQPVVKLDLAAIKKRGYITALVDNNSTSYFIYKGLPMGYEYELLQDYAKSIGVKLKLKVTSGVERAIDQLNTGEGDVLAFPLTITMERQQYLAYTKPHYNTHQVLVQRKPQNPTDTLVTVPSQLIGKEIHVIEGTVHHTRLENLTREIGGDVKIVTDSLTAESESLIRKVAMSEIDYTIADQMIAQVNATYYPNLDVKMIVSLPQQIAWGVRLNSPELRESLNTWLVDVKRRAVFRIIYNRYYKSPRTTLIRMRSSYSSLNGTRLSPYDKQIKAGAERIDWDWRLLASLIYQESRFLTAEESWAGARGIMQLMPATARRFGATNPDNPDQSIKAGTRYIQYLDTYWSRKVTDKDERIKFILASYNAGLSHVVDAYKLARKNGSDPTKWTGSVREYLLKKSKPAFYKDPVVAAGYCKCEETVDYVDEVLDRYEQYRLHISSLETAP